jgi:hypothetical protein
MLNNRRRWTDVHIHLRERSRRKQSESKQSCECNLFHSLKTPSALNFCRARDPPGSLLILNLNRTQKLRPRPILPRCTLVTQQLIFHRSN